MSFRVSEPLKLRSDALLGDEGERFDSLLAKFKAEDDRLLAEEDDDVNPFDEAWCDEFREVQDQLRNLGAARPPPPPAADDDARGAAEAESPRQPPRPPIAD